jgi:hypothetical protein
MTVVRYDNLVWHVKFTPDEAGKVRISANYQGNSNFTPSKDTVSFKCTGAVRLS